MSKKTSGGQIASLSPGSERPTLKTIAFMTGLGITTVSRALKDAPDISSETKERVRLVARQIGYQPNRAGVRLRTGKTNVICLILSLEEEIMGLSSPMVVGISEVLASTQYHLVVTPYRTQGNALDPVRYVLETGAADGVIISRTEPKDPRVALMMERNFPFATHGRTEMGLIHPYHDFDNERFAYEGVRKLVERGRKRLALLQPPPYLTFHLHMQAGFEKGIRDFGATAVPFSQVNLDSSLLDIRKASEALFSTPDAPDGIVAGSGSGAIAIVAALEAVGRRLGHDIDLVSKESHMLLQWLRPEVVTMREDIRLAGRELAKAVIARIEGIAPEDLQTLSYPISVDER
ncbi:LacI family transcriptional regulator [Shinella kummerowiae]|jgi:LacI family transcriptional regulator|uniref:LacI family DNA-binding transcriptional regulator n=1 Tax=Shinella kummerowiae TaxID=417745 RepID=A0A6N8S3M3_9HYPH|nr:LacI family transcriptional regulator [Shinella kummerowiae]MCT7663952.1 LacI family transcriptional regulator [Shinella kummerowiae]MXN43689.1 LacI family DNA-binding transcriptional regulator [Shinella kummerowiae]